MTEDTMFANSMWREWSQLWIPSLQKRSIVQKSPVMASVEYLESRQFLTAITISGIVFDDVNGDMVKQGGESPLAGAIVYLDQNNDGIFTPDEDEAIAVLDGSYQLTTEQTGEKHLRIHQQGVDHYTDSIVNILTANLPGVNLGVPRGFIKGTVFDDFNKNGTFDNADDVPHPNVTVYADNNGSGTLDTGDSVTVTDINGKYTLEKVLPGTVKVRVTPLAGFSTSLREINLKPGETVIQGTDFPLTIETATVSGTVYIDSDSNGLKNGPERGRSNLKVLLTPIVGGVDGLPVSQTLTDLNGKFSFSQLPTGLYKLKVSDLPGYSSTELNFLLSAGQILTNQNFGLTSTLKLNSAPLSYTTGTPEIRVTANTTIGTFAEPLETAEVIMTIKIVGRRLKDRLLLKLDEDSPVEITRGNIVKYNEKAVGQLTTPSKGVSVEVTFDPKQFVKFGPQTLAEILNSVRFRTPRRRESNTAYVQLQLQTGPDTLVSTRKLQIVRFKR